MELQNVVTYSVECGEFGHARSTPGMQGVEDECRPVGVDRKPRRKDKLVKQEECLSVYAGSEEQKMKKKGNMNNGEMMSTTMESTENAHGPIQPLQ